LQAESYQRKNFLSLRPYLWLLRGQYRQLILAVILMTASTGISLAIPVFAGRFVDDINLNLAAEFSASHLSTLALLLVLQLCGTFLFTVVSARLGLNTTARLRRRLYAHLLELPSLYFSEQKAGDISSRLTSDVGSVQYMLTNGLVSLARAILTLIGAVYLMFMLNPKLTRIVLLLIPSTILLVRLFGGRLQKLSRRMYDELGDRKSVV